MYKGMAFRNVSPDPLIPIIGFGRGSRKVIFQANLGELPFLFNPAKKILPSSSNDSPTDLQTVLTVPNPIDNKKKRQ